MTARHDLRTRFAARYEEPMPLDEYRRRRAQPMSDEEVAELNDLVRWFRSRYPTVQERFAYIRRKHREWTRTIVDE